MIQVRFRSCDSNQSESSQGNKALSSEVNSLNKITKPDTGFTKKEWSGLQHFPDVPWHYLLSEKLIFQILWLCILTPTVLAKDNWLKGK